MIPSGKPYLSRLVVDTMFDVSSFQDNGLVDTINIMSHNFKIMGWLILFRLINSR